MDLELIGAQCARECIRQHVGLKELAQLLQAYHEAVELSQYYRYPNKEQVLWVGARVEPIKGLVRSVPVTFANSRQGTAAEAIHPALTRLFEYVEGADPHEFTRAFLSIHPFADGNGRTAFILFNWLNNSLDAPLPLPDFGWD